MAVADPTLDIERELHDGGARFVIGCDEVGRGAIAGPVAVGLCVVDRERGPVPKGLRDSKMLAEPKREALAPLAAAWARFSAVGLASADEIDRFGIMAALAMAGKRALEAIADAGIPIDESIVLLDGHYDWLNPGLGTSRVSLTTRVKADRDCASVSAASVIAKVHRDRMMIESDVRWPGYSWTSNKGYGSSEHYEAIDRLGPSVLHRLSWLRQPALDIADA
jgi:ribonuclease HII